ncbi:hypothetical protein ABW19_dt0202923 [Dactylella cylindrospora]|nr:hypothetical protein ABW19_dt0202923 [Dactylella cylindrospora]
MQESTALHLKTPSHPHGIWAYKLTNISHIADTRLADRTASQSPNTTFTPSQLTDAAGETALQSLHSQITLLRTDLTASQRDRTTLQTQLTTATTHLSQLQKSSTANLRELDKVKNERYHLEQKLKQKEDESKVNRKMIEDLQDEILALNIQLDIADEAKKRLKGENEELISRWMALKREEADAMNNNSRFS